MKEPRFPSFPFFIILEKERDREGKDHLQVFLQVNEREREKREQENGSGLFIESTTANVHEKNILSLL